MTRWAILTGEYPPQSGGVSDYTRLVAEGLAAVGDEVAVYAPPQAIGPDSAPPGVRVRRLPDRFGLRGLRWLDRELARDRPDRILIQYVPHAFGLKAMNLPFAAWIAARARRVAPVWVMFHEVAFPFVRRPLRHNLLAIVNRVDGPGHSRCGRPGAGLDTELGAATEPRSARGPGRPSGCRSPAMWPPRPTPGWSPPPALRHAPDPAAPLVGHFGTFGRLITDLLEPAVVGLLRTDPRARVLLIGRGSERYRVHIGASHPDLAGRVAGTGELPPVEVAAHLRACDLLLQPYPDGVSSRRTSVMAGLANRVPVVTNLGALSEPLWAASTGVAVVPGPDPAALAAAAVEVLALSPENRLALGARGAELYFSEFTLERTIERLRRPGPTSDGTIHR